MKSYDVDIFDDHGFWGTMIIFAPNRGRALFCASRWFKGGTESFEIYDRNPNRLREWI